MIQFDVKDESIPMIVEDAVIVETPGSGGEPGKDGFSPIANVTQTDDGAVITITDKDGTTTATVTNGKDGEDGKSVANAHIAGKYLYLQQEDTGFLWNAGKVVPEKGVDYYTEADKAELVSAVIENLPVYDGSVV